jgi:threonine dehydrogenase-like Zn-dependent dehydrogenase
MIGRQQRVRKEFQPKKDGEPLVATPGGRRVACAFPCEAGCGVRRTHRCFVLAYSPLEFRDTLHMIAEGKIDCAPIVTETVALDGVDNAFTGLKDPEKHAETLIDPSSTATAPKS